MPGERTSVYLAADLAAAVKASGVPLAGLIRRGLAAAEIRHGVADSTAQTGTRVLDSRAENREPLTDSTTLGAIGPGELSPNVLCMTPGCFQRDTRKYGLRKLPLCTACADRPPEPRPPAGTAARRRTAHPPRHGRLILRRHSHGTP